MALTRHGLGSRTGAIDGGGVGRGLAGEARRRVAPRALKPAPGRIDPEQTRFRLVVLMVAAAIVAIALAGRLFYWQVLQHASLTVMAETQYQKQVVLPAQRGVIFDDAGLPLALNTPVYDIAAAPNEIPANERQTVAAALAPHLGLTVPQILARISDPSVQFVYLKRRLTQDQVAPLQNLDLPGIAELPGIRRSYLDGGVSGSSLASNLLGFVNDEGQGQYGLEGYYQSQLAGHNGHMSTFRDLADQEIELGTTQKVDPVDGAQLHLTLDSNIQYATEKALAAGVQQFQAQSGSVIVMNPSTGGIVAWADYPTYNANQFGTADASTIFDPVVSGGYEPGSVMKVLTLSGALETGAITPDGHIMENGVFNVGGYAIHNWDGRAHGDVTWTYVLEDSLNVGAAMAEQRMGNQPFWTFLDRFGIGHPTGVDVQGEVNPGLPPVDQLRDVQLATMSFGQGVSVTPIQMLAAINAVANGGVWIQPHVLDHYVDSAGSVTDFVPAQHQALLPQTAATMRDMMIQVVEHGSGGLAKIPGFSGQIAGKTGTAQVPGPGGYTDQVIGSFVGFLPAQNPRFTMLVIMREPKILFEGAYVAAPIWKEIAQQMIVQWRIAPQ